MDKIPARKGLALTAACAVGLFFTAAAAAPARPTSSAGKTAPGKQAPGKRPTPPPPPPPPPPPIEPPTCAPGDNTVTLLETESEIKCEDGFVNCVGEVKLAARNCTGEFQLFSRVEIYEDSRRIQVLEFSPAPIAPPNKIWREGIPWNTPASLIAEVFYHPPGQTGEQSVRGPVRIVNKPLAAAKEACQNCQGVWGTWGVNKLEGCNCKTTDAGKMCIDGDECQGYCLFRRYNGEGREEGMCSDTQRLVGCYPIIFKGAKDRPPILPPPRKRETCVD